MECDSRLLEMLEHPDENYDSTVITAMSNEILFTGEKSEIKFSKPEVIVVDAAGRLSHKFDGNYAETIVGHRQRKDE